MNKIKKRLLKVISVIIVCIICVNFCCVSSYAAAITWSLVKTDGPSSEWIIERTYGFDATNKNIYITCYHIGNDDARAHAEMPNPEKKKNGKELFLIRGDLTKGASLSTTNVVKGRNYLMRVTYASYGTGYSNPSGVLTY